MGRIHGIELHEQPWCPPALRDGVTDSLRQIASLLRLYEPIVPHLVKAMEQVGTRRIVDLCAGGGGPWQHLLHELPEFVEGITLTDYYPNLPAFERAVEATAGRVAFHPESVNAMHVPEGLDGFRTLFASFHHFRPDQARAILQNAADSGVGIGVFEIIDRSLLSLLTVAAGSPISSLVFTPFTRPFRWSRLLWTYAVPAIPVMLGIDGVVSCLRTYSLAELRALVDDLDAPHYEWKIGLERGLVPMPLTYLIGVPRRGAPLAR